MNEPTPSEAQARSAVAVVVVVVVSFVCVLVLAGLTGATYFWLKEKKLSSERAEDHATRIDWLKGELDAIRQDQAAVRIEHANQQSGLRNELKQHQQAYRSLKAGLFAFDEPLPSEPAKDGPTDYPQPTETGVWAGELRTEHGRPAEYSLPFRGPIPIRPYPTESLTSTRAPFAFNQDRSKFFIVDPDSVLRRFDSTSLMEEMALKLGAECFDLAMTAGGLAVSLPTRDAVWIIDAERMDVLGEVPLKHANHLAATPTSEEVYAIGQDQAIGFDPRTRQINRALRFDKTGSLPGAADRFNNRLASFAMHPDGKHLFTASGSPIGVHQFTINPTGIQHKAAVPIGRRRNDTPLFISPDGRLLAKPGASSMVVFDGHRPEVGRLQIKGYAELSACTFDPACGMVAASAMVRHNLHLNLYNTDGGLEASFWLRGLGKKIHRLEALPMGQRYLFWSDKGIWISDIQHNRITAAVPEERLWNYEQLKEDERRRKEAEERRRNPQF